MLTQGNVGRRGAISVFIKCEVADPMLPCLRLISFDTVIHDHRRGPTCSATLKRLIFDHDDHSI